MNAVVAPEPPRRSLLERQRMALEMISRDAPLTDTLALLCHIVEAEAEQPVRASILLVDREANCLRTGAAPGLPDAYNRAVDGIGISSEVGTCAAAAALGTVVTTPDIGADPRWSGLSHLPLRLGLVAAWSMPIQRADRTVLGTLGTYFTERRVPSEQEMSLVAFLAQTAALAIERAESHRTEQAGATA
jgi:GAF domain-containing protein